VEQEEARAAAEEEEAVLAEDKVKLTLELDYNGRSELNLRN